MTSFQRPGDILQGHPLNNPRNVNNVGKDISDNVKNVETNKEDGGKKKYTSNPMTVKFLELLKEFSDEKAKNDWLIKTFEEKLEDDHSRKFYKMIIKKYPPEQLLTFLAVVKDTNRQRKIKKSKAAYFTWLVKNQGKQKI